MVGEDAGRKRPRRSDSPGPDEDLTMTFHQQCSVEAVSVDPSIMLQREGTSGSGGSTTVAWDDKTMCGNHLHNLVILLKKRKREIEGGGGKGPEIRIRSDIFEADMETNANLDGPNPEDHFVQLQNVRKSAVKQLMASLRKLQSAVTSNSASLESELETTLRETRDNMFDLSLQVLDPRLPPETKSRDLIITFATAADYMGSLMSCVELEAGLNTQWKTAVELIKHRIARILRSCSCWTNASFTMNYSKSVEPNRLDLYLRALDFVNTISNYGVPNAVLDHNNIGPNGFKRQIQVLTAAISNSSSAQATENGSTSQQSSPSKTTTFPQNNTSQQVQLSSTSSLGTALKTFVDNSSQTDGLTPETQQSTTANANGPPPAPVQFLIKKRCKNNNVKDFVAAIATTTTEGLTPNLTANLNNNSTDVTNANTVNTIPAPLMSLAPVEPRFQRTQSPQQMPPGAPTTHSPATFQQQHSSRPDYGYGSYENGVRNVPPLFPNHHQHPFVNQHLSHRPQPSPRIQYATRAQRSPHQQEYMPAHGYVARDPNSPVEYNVPVPRQYHGPRGPLPPIYSHPGHQIPEQSRGYTRFGT